MWSTTENLKLIFNFDCDEFLLTRLLLLQASSLRLEEMPENWKNEFKTDRDHPRHLTEANE